jgi:hypothetical protein
MLSKKPLYIIITSLALVPNPLLEMICAVSSGS